MQIQHIDESGVWGHLEVDSEVVNCKGDSSKNKLLNKKISLQSYQDYIPTLDNAAISIFPYSEWSKSQQATRICASSPLAGAEVIVPLHPGLLLLLHGLFSFDTKNHRDTPINESIFFENDPRCLFSVKYIYT